MSEAPIKKRAVDRAKVERLLAELDRVTWSAEGRVAMLVETPEPHRHRVRRQVEVVEGKGFAGDHRDKATYRNRYVPGREVSAVTLEVLQVLGVPPSVVGDNLVTRGIDLASLRVGDLVEAGEVLLERSARAHRPCATFRDRSSPEAFAVVSRRNYRGALFVVRKGGLLKLGDAVRVVN